MSLFGRLLHEDEHCLAVVKRAGQFIQGDWAPPGEQTLEQAVRCYLCPDDPASVYLGIVHRLDRPVSGVVIWAKTTKAARRLSMRFERRQVEKEYWAIVETHTRLTDPEGLWTDWLTRADASGVVSAVPPGTKGSRQATTRYQRGTAASLPNGCDWLRLFPETGRTHQLRIQTARRGCPILGDSAYGARQAFAPGIALHAHRLRLRHPITQQSMDLRATLPESWERHDIRLPAGDSPC